MPYVILIAKLYVVRIALLHQPEEMVPGVMELSAADNSFYFFRIRLRIRIQNLHRSVTGAVIRSRKMPVLCILRQDGVQLFGKIRFSVKCCQEYFNFFHFSGFLFAVLPFRSAFGKTGLSSLPGIRPAARPPGFFKSILTNP